MIEQSSPVDFSNVFGEGENTAKERTFDLLPAGLYQARIIESSEKTSKAGAKYLAMAVEIIAEADGNPSNVKGRRLFTNFNLWHVKPEVRERAKSDVREVAHACQLSVFRTSTDFHNIPLLVKVKLKKASEQDKEKGFEDANEIGGWKPLRDAAPVTTAFVPPVAASAPAWTPPPAQAAPAWTPPPAQAAPAPAAVPPVLDASKPPWA